MQHHHEKTIQYEIVRGSYSLSCIIGSTVKKLFTSESMNFSLISILALVPIVKILLSVKRYQSFIKSYSNIKIILVGYDVLCPPEFIIAGQLMNVRCIGLQERLNTAYANIYPLILDDYFVIGENVANHIKQNRNADIKNLKIIGPIRSSWLRKRINLQSTKKASLDILVLDCASRPQDERPNILSANSWENNKLFIEDILEIAGKMENCKFIIRGKDTNWVDIPYFNDLVKRVYASRNISISNSYDIDRFSYDLVNKCDLVVCRHTSLAEEAMAAGIPTFFYERTVNGDIWMRSLVDYNDYAGYMTTKEDLIDAIKSIMNGNSQSLMKSISNLNKTYFGDIFHHTSQDRLNRHLDELQSDLK